MKQDIELYSFDIFDTLVTRTVAEPKGIFVLIQEILKSDDLYSDIPADVKYNFFNYREDCEFRLRCLNKINYEGRDITFDDIYKQFQEIHFLTDEQIEKIKNLEIQTEINNIVPITENIERIKSLLEQNKRVILISDMYLPENVIKTILNKANPILSDLKLYLSSVLGYMKTTCKLFEYVKEKENVEYSNWLHVGDNEYCDCECAAKLGINVERYPYVKLEDYEKELLQKEFLNSYVQLSIGCSKNIRLLEKDKSEKYKFGASFSAPIFYPYINWILEQSIKRGIKRLYFIARDGYILKLMADVLITEKHLGIETSYIYGSRKAWRAPALSIDNKELYKQFVETAMWSYKKLDEQFEIPEKEFAGLLPKEFKNYKKGKFKLSKLKKLKELLISNDEFLKRTVEYNKEKKKLAIKYLKENINCEDSNFAFVELDGSGFSQNCLAELMEPFYKGNLISFYLASTPGIFNSKKVKRLYFYGIKTPLLANTLELLTKAPHGQTICYDKTGNPVLEEDFADIIKKWELDKYIEGILEYTKTFKCRNVIQHNIMRIYSEFIHYRINRDVANIVGSIPHSFCGTENREYAPILNILDLIRLFFTNKCNSENLNFSKMRSGKLASKIIDYKQKYPSLRKEIINININKKKHFIKFTLFGMKLSIKKGNR